MTFFIIRESFNTSSVCNLMEVIMWSPSEIVCLRERRCRVLNWYVVNLLLCFNRVSFYLEETNTLIIIQVKATATNVDEAVRELPDANTVRYINSWLLIKDVKNMNAIDLQCILASRRPVGCTLKACLSSASQYGEYVLESNTKGKHQATLLFTLFISHPVLIAIVSFVDPSEWRKSGTTSFQANKAFGLWWYWQVPLEVKTVLESPFT